MPYYNSNMTKQIILSFVQNMQLTAVHIVYQQ